MTNGCQLWKQGSNVVHVRRIGAPPNCVEDLPVRKSPFTGAIDDQTWDRRPTQRLDPGGSFRVPP